MGEEAEDESAELMAHSAREQAIHEAVAHAIKATETARDAAEMVLNASNEAMQARRALDAHDVITIENQTAADVAKAELARGMDATAEEMPWPLCLLPPPSSLTPTRRTGTSFRSQGASRRRREQW